MFSEKAESRPGCQHSLRRRWVLEWQEGLASPGEGREQARAQAERTRPGRSAGLRGRRVSRRKHRWGGRQKPDAEALAWHAVRVWLNSMAGGHWWCSDGKWLDYSAFYLLLDLFYFIFKVPQTEVFMVTNWNCLNTGKGSFPPPPPTQAPASSPSCPPCHTSCLFVSTLGRLHQWRCFPPITGI